MNSSGGSFAVRDMIVAVTMAPGEGRHGEGEKAHGPTAIGGVWVHRALIGWRCEGERKTGRHGPRTGARGHGVAEHVRMRMQLDDYRFHSDWRRRDECAATAGYTTMDGPMRG